MLTFSNIFRPFLASNSAMSCGVVTITEPLTGIFCDSVALALQAEGAKVALLDADIYGPSQPRMLGVSKLKPEQTGEGKLLPILHLLVFDDSFALDSLGGY
jgi:hypothetical protein